MQFTTVSSDAIPIWKLFVEANFVSQNFSNHYGICYAEKFIYLFQNYLIIFLNYPRQSHHFFYCSMTFFSALDWWRPLQKTWNFGNYQTVWKSSRVFKLQCPKQFLVSESTWQAEQETQICKNVLHQVRLP